MGPHHELVVRMWACLELPTKLLNERLANGPDSLILLYTILLLPIDAEYTITNKLK
jgi:hypothetical protein